MQLIIWWYLNQSHEYTTTKSLLGLPNRLRCIKIYRFIAKTVYEKENHLKGLEVWEVVLVHIVGRWLVTVVADIMTMAWKFHTRCIKRCFYDYCWILMFLWCACVWVCVCESVRAKYNSAIRQKWHFPFKIESLVVQLQHTIHTFLQHTYARICFLILRYLVPHTFLILSDLLHILPSHTYIVLHLDK